MSNRYSKGRHAVFICDRSGFKYPYKEGVIEPGTGFFVHYTENDGKYSLVSHPQNNPRKRYQFGDPKPLKNPRPEINLDTDFLSTEGGDLMTTEEGDTLVV
jgi:hypothetical protein